MGVHVAVAVPVAVGERRWLSEGDRLVDGVADCVWEAPGVGERVGDVVHVGVREAVWLGPVNVTVRVTVAEPGADDVRVPDAGDPESV